MIETLPQLAKDLSWDEAWLYCACLNYNGYNDWRMPTESESVGNLLTTWIDIYTPNVSLIKYRIVPVRGGNHA